MDCTYVALVSISFVYLVIDGLLHVVYVKLMSIIQFHWVFIALEVSFI